MILPQKYHRNNLKLEIPSEQDDITATMQQDVQLHPLAGFASIVFGYTRSTGANFTPPIIVWKLIEAHNTSYTNIMLWFEKLPGILYFKPAILMTSTIGDTIGSHKNIHEMQNGWVWLWATY